jgi:hypothetical protein
MLAIASLCTWALDGPGNSPAVSVESTPEMPVTIGKVTSRTLVHGAATDDVELHHDTDVKQFLGSGTW